MIAQMKEDGEDKEEYRRLSKIIMLGDTGVGKSCIVNRYIKNTFHEEVIPTMLVDMERASVRLDDGSTTDVSIWDTAGQEAFRSMLTNYYRACKGIVLVYSVASANSFIGLLYWYEEIMKHKDDSCSVILVGNKSDCPAEQREVSTAMGRSYANKYELDFIETSAKTGYKIAEMFEKLTHSFTTKYIEQLELENASLRLQLEGGRGKKGAKGKGKKDCTC